MSVDSIITPSQTKNTIVSKVHSAYNYSVFELLFDVDTTLLDKVTMYLEFSDNLGAITESNTYNYSVLNVDVMRRDVSQILKSQIKTVCPLDFNVPAGEVVSDPKSYQMYRLCVVFGDAEVLRSEWCYAGAGVFQKFHERKGNFIDYMVHIETTAIDIYFGFPASFRDAIAYRFNAKDTDNFAIRVDGGFDYVESYTDPISTKVVAQGTASNQPKLVAGGVYFDGVNDNLNNLTSGLNGIREAWAVTTYDLALAKDFDAIFTVHDVNPNVSASLFLFSGTNAFISPTAKVNNIATNVFLPATTRKTASDTFADFTITPSQLYIGQDRSNTPRNWQGQVLDVILFNRVLTAGERTELQTYLETLHSF